MHAAGSDLATEYFFGIWPAADQASQCNSFILRRALAAPNGFAISADLGVDRLAQPEALIPKLVNVFGLESVCRRVDVADGLEKAEREENVNSGEHRNNASKTPCKVRTVGLPS